MRNLKIKKQPATRRHQFHALTFPPPPTKVKESFMSFPSSPSNLVRPKPCVEIQHPPHTPPTGTWIPAFDCHRAGRLPSGSHSQEVRHSCRSLVTSYPGGGSISMVKQQIPSLGLTISKIFRNCVIFPQRANPKKLVMGKGSGYQEMVGLHTSCPRSKQFQRKYL